MLLRGVGDVGARPAAEQPVSHEAFRLGEVPGRDKVYVRREPNLMKMNGKEGREKQIRLLFSVEVGCARAARTQPDETEKGKNKSDSCFQLVGRARGGGGSVNQNMNDGPPTYLVLYSYLLARIAEQKR